jgi:hypothetical protein
MFFFFFFKWMMPTALTQLWHPSDTMMSCMCSKTAAYSHSFILWFTGIKNSWHPNYTYPSQVSAIIHKNLHYSNKTSTCMKPQYLAARLNPYRILQLRLQTFLLFEPAIYLSKKYIYINNCVKLLPSQHLKIIKQYLPIMNLS